MKERCLARNADCPPVPPEVHPATHLLATPLGLVKFPKRVDNHVAVLSHNLDKGGLDEQAVRGA